MDVVIVSYRRGSNDQNPNQVIVRFPSYQDACNAIGKRLVFEDTKGNKYIGKVLRPHGKRGAAIATFRPNLPGQALGKVAKLE